MDWGLSAAIVAVIAFIVTQVIDGKVKKLNDRIATIEAAKLGDRVEVCELNIEALRGDVSILIADSYEVKDD